MIATPKRWVCSSLVLAGAVGAIVFAVVAVIAGVAPARAHRTPVPHQLVMTQVAIEGDSLRVSVWVERPTAVVVEEFRAAFEANRQRSDEQNERFRRAQWQRLNDGLFVLVNGEPLEIELTPLPLANNGRGDAEKFVYAVGGALPLSAVTRGARVVVELDNQVLFDQQHVFLSAYAEAQPPWRVVEDSNAALLAKAERTAAELAPDGATWSHDERIRRWRIVFDRAQ